MANTVKVNGIDEVISSLSDERLTTLLKGRKGLVTKFTNKSPAPGSADDIKLQTYTQERDDLQAAFDSRGLTHTRPSGPTPTPTPAEAPLPRMKNFKAAQAELKKAETELRTAATTRDTAQTNYDAIKSLKEITDQIPGQTSRLKTQEDALTKLNEIEARRRSWTHWAASYGSFGLSASARQRKDDKAFLKTEGQSYGAKGLEHAIHARTITRNTEQNKLNSLNADKATAESTLASLGLGPFTDLARAETDALNTLNQAKEEANLAESRFTRIQTIRDDFQAERSQVLKKWGVAAGLGVVTVGALLAATALTPPLIIAGGAATAATVALATGAVQTKSLSGAFSPATMATGAAAAGLAYLGFDPDVLQNLLNQGQGTLQQAGLGSFQLPDWITSYIGDAQAVATDTVAVTDTTDAAGATDNLDVADVAADTNNADTDAFTADKIAAMENSVLQDRLAQAEPDPVTNVSSAADTANPTLADAALDEHVAANQAPEAGDTSTAVNSNSTTILNNITAPDGTFVAPSLDEPGAIAHASADFTNVAVDPTLNTPSASSVLIQNTTDNAPTNITTDPPAPVQVAFLSPEAGTAPSNGSAPVITSQSDNHLSYIGKSDITNDITLPPHHDIVDVITKPAEFIPHEVASGEDVWTITADHFGLENTPENAKEIQLLSDVVIELNGMENLEGNGISPGQTLNLPNLPAEEVITENRADGSLTANWKALDADIADGNGPDQMWDENKDNNSAPSKSLRPSIRPPSV